MSTEPASPNNAATEALNRHGYAFSEAVANAVFELSHKNRIHWAVAATEFPVSLNGVDTHIDILLSDKFDSTYIAVECKRVDPAIGRWLFARADTIVSTMSGPKVVFEDILPPNSAGLTHVAPHATYIGENPFHYAVEQRTQEKKGDGKGGQSDAVSRAVTQALRGASGFVEHAMRAALSKTQGRSIRVIPAVVTTAELWTTESVLGRAPLESGNLDAASVEWKPAEWLWFNHNRSISLQPRASAPTEPSSMSSWLEAYSTRSVAVVSAAHLSTFLRYHLR